MALLAVNPVGTLKKVRLISNKEPETTLDPISSMTITDDKLMIYGNRGKAISWALSLSNDKTYTSWSIDS